MAFVFQERYEPHIEERMRAFWETLSERDRRRFAALEAARLGHGGTEYIAQVRLGHGGTEYIAQVLECSTRTIERGADELDQLPTDPEFRVRVVPGTQYLIIVFSFSRLAWLRTGESITAA